MSELAELARALRERRWFVFGAHAVGVWALPRQTLDIDVVVDVSDAELPALLDDLARSGFQPRAPDPLQFALTYRVIPLASERGGTVDVVLAGTTFERDALSAATIATVLGVSVPVVTADYLVVFKLGSDRAKDGEDARAVIRAQADHLDAGLIRSHLRDLEVAMDRSDLVTEFNALLARHRTRP